MVDLGQLWEYTQRPTGTQPFYVFPAPHWDGDLASAAGTAGHPVTELAYARSGSWWFATWMVVLTTQQVANILHAELRAHGGPHRKAKTRLVRYRPNPTPNRPLAIWGRHAPKPQPVRWRDFWQTIEQCGRPGWPQLVRVPASAITSSPRKPSNRDIQRILALSVNWPGDDDLLTLEPTGDGLFQPATPADPDTTPTVGGSPDRRIAVFLDAKALASI